MLEYRFRGKRKDNGDWVRGGIITKNNYTAIVVCSDYHCWHEFVEVDPETVGQYTGVRERYQWIVGEGQEIYFGDVVRIFGGEYCQGYYEHDKKIIIKNIYDVMAMEESENVQLLGNIYNDKELLREVG